MAMDDSWDRLLAELGTARARYELDPDETPEADDEPNTRMEGAQAALSAVLNYLRAQAVDPALYRPLYDLHLALADIDDGTPNKLLERRKKPGKPRMAHNQELRMVTAAAAVTLYINAGWSEDDAARRVVRFIPGVRPERLKGFRDKISERSARIRQQYEGLLGYKERVIADVAAERGCPESEVEETDAACVAARFLTEHVLNGPITS